MIDLTTYTLIHVVISLAALGTGVPLLFAFAAGKARPALATVTIALLVLTSATGFGFPFEKILPSHAVGVVSLVVLVVAIVARWGWTLAGRWLTVYSASLAVAVYLDAFVALVQAFKRIPPLHAIAPSEQSPGFAIGHLVLLIVFAALGRAAVRGLRPAPATASQAPRAGQAFS